ncbi:MAG: GNAT family N-acetyltransferase [Pseudomonadaceae bacterium]|nr:GNAT family N-acetyltransferase [Pseudomonadaceae bacterium]
MKLTRYQTGDAAALRAVFHTAVQQTAAPYYSAAERRQWSPEAFDEAAWAANLAKIKPWVLWDKLTAIAYADLQPTGYIDHFYVHGDYARQGIGQTLFNHLAAQAQEMGVTELSADVSLSAEAFFKRQGFTVSWRRRQHRGGVVLRNARMLKPL